MLRELHISNLAVIADARVELDAGLNCFTGATGAGKSLVIGAVEILLGLRSTSDMLRAGADEGRVTGVFHVAPTQQLKAIDSIADVNVSTDGGEVLLVRKLHASGRSSASLNGHPITLQMLKSIGEILVDVHGQNDQQFLLRPSNQLEVLDQFAGAESLRARYRIAWAELSEARRKLDELSTGQKLRAQQLDLLNFQADEIDRAELDPAEFRELEARASVLANLERLRKETTQAYTALYDAEGSILDRLKLLQAIIAEMASVDPALGPTNETLKNGVIQLEEAAFDLGRYTQRLDLDPAELVEVNERLNVINRVLRKYGANVEAVLSFRADLGKQILHLSRAGEDASDLAKKIAPLEADLKDAGAKLNAARTRAAKTLGPRIDAQLAELGMEKARFSVAVTPSREPGASGLDDVEFIVRTNPGLPEQPLRRIASGGEVGRIMLALKGVLARGERAGSPSLPSASVLVFDEIDANIGGRLGSIIGAKLRDLSRHHQVLCITHLPQIAAFADRHLTVSKEQSGERTTTSVRVVTGPARVEELASMIGGKNLTDTTRAQAREMLHDAGNTSPVPESPAPSRPSAPRRRTSAK